VKLYVAAVEALRKPQKRKKSKKNERQGETEKNYKKLNASVFFFFFLGPLEPAHFVVELTIKVI